MFYVPMQQFMGLSNTQIGGALSAYGIVQTIGLIAGIYICDMFSKKYMIGGSLIGLGAVGVYLSTFPGYWGFLAAFGVMAILGEVTYWPVLLKAIRLLGDEKTQGRMFGFLEMGRGIVDVIIASTALAIFKAMGEGAGALRGGLLFLLYRKFLLNHELCKQIALQKQGTENRRLRFRRYKNLLLQNRHRRYHQIHVKSNPYPKGPHHSCRGLHQRSSLPVGFGYIVSAVPLQVLLPLYV